jgi:hypothetical protein
LTSSISSHSNWFYCFMPKTNPLACHHKHFSLIGFSLSIGSFVVIPSPVKPIPIFTMPTITLSRGSHCLQNLRNLLSFLFQCLPVCSLLRPLHHILLQYSLVFSYVLLIPNRHLCLHTYRYEEIF